MRDSPCPRGLERRQRCPAPSKFRTSGSSFLSPFWPGGRHAPPSCGRFPWRMAPEERDRSRRLGLARFRHLSASPSYQARPRRCSRRSRRGCEARSARRRER
jgi:hypothetical protein